MWNGHRTLVPAAQNQSLKWLKYWNVSNVKLLMVPSLSTAGNGYDYSNYMYTSYIPSSDGIGRSGTFCALMASINRFKAEQMVDVFKTIITMRTQRPGLVANAVRNLIHCLLLDCLLYLCRSSSNLFMRLWLPCWWIMPPILISLVITQPVTVLSMKTFHQALCDHMP